MANTSRKRRRRKDARPEEIVRAAFQEMSEKGIARSTLGSIAARAGISRTTVYLYFPTKQDVFKAVVRETVERTIDEAAVIVGTPTGSFAELFRRVIDTVYERLVEGEASVVLKALVAEGSEQAELVAFYHAEILSKGRATIEQLIAFGLRSGELDERAGDLDPRLLVSPAIFAAIWGLVFERVEPLDLKRFRQNHVDVMLHGLLRAGTSREQP